MTLGLAVAATAFAQPAPVAGGWGAGQGPGMGPRIPVRQFQYERMESNFFPPQLVMRHQEDIGLTPDQQATLRSETAKFVGHLVDLRWEQCASEQTLAALLKQEKPDEKAILAEQEKLTKIEGDIQGSRLAMLIHIKNVLTPEQKAKLTELKKGMEHHPWGAHEMWRHGMGFCPCLGEGPVCGPGMIRPFQRRFPIHGGGMNPGGQLPANPMPAPPMGEEQP